MTRPTRATTPGRVYLQLRARARREGRPTDELLVLYVLERFLYRLSVSAHRERLVLKGGMLLSALGQRRPTRDVDLLAKGTSNDTDPVAALVSEVLMIHVDDGVVYEPDRMTARVIREQDMYAAVRIAVPACVDRARHPLRVDVNVGDPVTPAPAAVDYPALLGEPFRVLAYPIETLLAEKLVTMVARGDATTRDRDFADVVLLTRRHAIDAGRLSAAVTATSAYRRVRVRTLGEVLVTLGRDRHADWQRYIARVGLQGILPSSFAEAIRQVTSFADPVLSGSVSSGRWDHLSARWTT